jgi:hypothetical protein
MDLVCPNIQVLFEKKNLTNKQVISVLATISDPALMEHLQQIPFLQQIIGTAPRGGPGALALGPNPASLKKMEARQAVAEALEGSDLDVVRRLTPDARYFFTYTEFSKHAAAV